MKRSSPGADIDSVRLSAGDKINVRQFQRTIAMDPTFPLAHEYFFFLLKTMGRFEEGIKEYEKSEVLGGSSPEDAAGEAAMMRQALKKGGEKGLWQKTLQLTLERQVSDRRSGPLDRCTPTRTSPDPLPARGLHTPRPLAATGPAEQNGPLRSLVPYQCGYKPRSGS